MKKVVKVTKHEIKRAATRLGLSKRESKKLANEAFLTGSNVDNFKGRRQEYIQKKQLYGCNVVVYKDNIFIFDENKGVTVYKAPVWFSKKIRKTADGKYIRNFYKYKKYNREKNYYDELVA